MGFLGKKKNSALQVFFSYIALALCLVNHYLLKVVSFSIFSNLGYSLFVGHLDIHGKVKWMEEEKHQLCHLSHEKEGKSH